MSRWPHADRKPATAAPLLVALSDRRLSVFDASRAFDERERCLITGWSHFRRFLWPHRSLSWLKIKWGQSAFVLAGPGPRRRALPIVPCAEAVRDLVTEPASPPYTRCVAELHDIPDRLRDEVADHDGPVQAPAGRLATFRDATLIGSGAIVTNEGCLVAESLLNTDLWLEIGRLSRATVDAPFSIDTKRVETQKRLLGRCVLMKQAYDANYGHWLIECLPRLQIVAAHADLSECRFIVSGFHGAMDRLYRETLEACGVRADQLEPVGWEAVHVDHLIYPLPITNHPWVKSPRVVDFLEDLGRRILAGDPGPDRLYVSRNNGKSRRLLNEEEVIARCEPLGFVVCHPETLSFAEQVRLFSNASIVIGNYGANLTNVVFSPRGGTLFALTTEAMGDDFFWDLIGLKQGRYISLHGQAAEPPPHLDSDFTVDVAMFESLLETCLPERRGGSKPGGEGRLGR